MRGRGVLKLASAFIVCGLPLNWPLDIRSEFIVVHSELHQITEGNFFLPFELQKKNSMTTA
jgi:hypothetical protein